MNPTPHEPWGVSSVVASKPRGPGSTQVLMPEQLQIRKRKSFSFQDGEKLFSLKYI